MKFFLFSLLSLLILVQVYSFDDDDKLIRINVNSKNDAINLHQYFLNHSADVDLWHEPIVNSRVLAQFTNNTLKGFEKLGIDFEIANQNITQLFEQSIQKEQLKQSVRHRLFLSNKDEFLDNFNLDEYHSYDEIKEFLQNAEKKTSSLLGVKMITLGKTYENRPIYALTIGKEALLRKKILILECGIHAREWVSGAGCLKIIDKLILNPDEVGTAILNRYDVTVIPIMNPDGFEYSRNRDRSWRKNRSKNLAITPFCRGSDVNRNFDVAFGTVGVDPNNPCSIIYCGKKAFSEKESQALRDYALSIKDSLAVYISLHSFSQLLLYPYGHVREVPNNNDELNRLASLAKEAISNKQKQEYKFGNIYTAIYPASGSTLDWIALNTASKFNWVFEMRDTGEYGFLLPEELINPAFMDVWTGIEKLLEI